MKKICTLCCLVSFSFAAFSQNLVPNSDFEIYGTVPCGWTSSSIDFANATNSWNSPTQATPDIFSHLINPSCSNYQPLSTDPFCNGYQVPYSGDIFAGFYTQVGGSTWREYLQVQLTQPMVVGQKYDVAMYVSLSDNSIYATNNIGVGFSTSITNLNITNELGYTPQMNFTDVISDTVDWVYLEDTITATAAWQYIIIGNFFNDGSTNIVTVNAAGVWDRAYYYVDDVSIQESNQGPSSSFAANETAVCEKFCVSFTDSSANDPASWQWEFPGGSPSSSTDQNPGNVCYDVPGVYDVTLITSNSNGSDTLTLADYITVFETPAFPTITQNGYTLTSSAATSYQWQLNAIDIPGATDQTYEVMQTGFYTVMVSDSNGCMNSTMIYVEITGLNEVGEESFSISPNPSLGEFVIELINPDVVGQISISVLNSLGQEVFSSQEKISQTDWKKEIELQNAVAGIYFIEIRSSDQFIRKKIMIAD